MSSIILNRFKPAYVVEEIKDFCILSNTPQNDKNHNSIQHCGLGQSSMCGSSQHKFLSPNYSHSEDPHFMLNASSFKANEKTLKKLQQMKDTALIYAKKQGWVEKEEELVLFFHLIEKCSMLHLRLHFFPKKSVGPSYFVQLHKNVPLHIIERFLKQEMSKPKDFSQFLSTDVFQNKNN